MTLKYSCFISYSSSSELEMLAARQLKEALENEIGAWIRGKDIYIYEGELDGGDIYSEVLKDALCRSVCMIMIFTKSYFHEDYTFCTKEFLMMEALEKRRLKKLKISSAKKHGLIIPIILRGEEYIPKCIKKFRQCHNFEDYHTPIRKGANLFLDDKRFRPIIRDIIKYISKRDEELKDLRDIKKECEDLKIPEDEIARNWIKTEIRTGYRFPLTGEDHDAS